MGGRDPPTLDLRAVSYPQFATAQSRRSTFSEWSRDHPLQPEELVAGGFFYAGRIYFHIFSYNIILGKNGPTLPFTRVSLVFSFF